MHFRERGHVVQVIRTTYDPATKKGKNEIVGRLVKSKPQVTDELKAVLSREELKEVAAWIAGYAKTEALRRELAVRGLSEQMALAEEWFVGQKGEEAHFLASSLVPAWARLRAALKRNGMIE